MARLAGHKAGLEIQAAKIEEKLAREIAVVAQDFVPVKSGKTKSSIRAEAREGAWAVVADRKGDRPDVPVYLEFGTRYMAAQPFMVPAADLVLAARGLNDVVRSVGGLLMR
jgi:hypothetical protein